MQKRQEKKSYLANGENPVPKIGVPQKKQLGTGFLKKWPFQ